MPRAPRTTATALERPDALPELVVDTTSALAEVPAVALAVPVRPAGGEAAGVDDPAGASQDDTAPAPSTAPAPPTDDSPPVPGAGLRPGPGSADVEQAFGLVLLDELAHQRANAAAGETVEVPIAAPDLEPDVLLLVGTGSGDAAALRRAGAGLARRAAGRTSLATTLGAQTGTEELRAAVEGMLAAAYRPLRISGRPAGDRLSKITLVLGAGGKAARRSAQAEAVRRARVTAAALAQARDLTNAPADIAGPVELAEQARRAGEAAGLRVRVRDEQELRSEGFGGLVAVGAGSRRPPRLVELSYEPESAGRRPPHVVLAGKGIAFDTGGLSLKPRESMVAMKTDMAGAAVVLAVVCALAELGVRARVTGLLALAENMPDGGAYRPGDVITQYDGTTVEVLNTDAEGRLVLADALGYASKELAPDLLVDVATLTGAASLGLGRRHGALYATHEPLAGALLEAAERSGERLWRMPLVEDYRAALESPVADLAHVPHDNGLGGGSITAALFLREFVGRAPWAHLDIAGPARADADDFDISRGGTGFGTRLLLRWLEDLR